MKKNIYKKYAELLVKAENATGRQEANFLIKKAKKLQKKLVLAMQNFQMEKILLIKIFFLLKKNPWSGTENRITEIIIKIIRNLYTFF